MPHYYGCHVSVAGGLHNGLAAAKRLGINTIQCHPSPPQRWNSKPFGEGVEARYLEALKASGVKKVFFHAIYLINLATPDPQKFHLAKLSLVHYLELAARVRADGVIFHVGSAKDQAEEKDGLKRAAEGLNWILDATKSPTPILLEVAAGSGAVIGDRMEELKAIHEMVDDKKRIGFALDTQHMWASGYDIGPAVIDDVAHIFGLKKVKAIHLNDSMTPQGSKKDRHQNLGTGTIGEAKLSTFFSDPRLADIPFILETPAMKNPDETAAEVETLNAWAKKA